MLKNHTESTTHGHQKDTSPAAFRYARVQAVLVPLAFLASLRYAFQDRTFLASLEAVLVLLAFLRPTAFRYASVQAVLVPLAFLASLRYAFQDRTFLASLEAVLVLLAFLRPAAFRYAR